MIDGIWWLVILLAVVAALWLLAKSRSNDKPNNKGKPSNLATSATLPNNDALQKTLKLIKQHFPDYRVARKGSHLLISKQGVKIAMITIDKKIAVGQRRLGEVPVMNYHRVPNRTQIATSLQHMD